MANHECSISDAEAGILTNPTATPNFINANYTEPTNKPAPNFSIQIYVGETPYEFKRHYLAGTAEGEGVYASRGFCSFQIANDNRTAFNLPFLPVRYQKVVITDALGEIFTGYIKNTRREILGYRSDGSAMFNLTIECQDVWELLEEDTYNEVYISKKAGFILRDAFTRAGFDVQDIDPDLGPTFDEYPVIEQFPAEVINHILGLIDYTYWIERTSLRPQVFARDSVQSELFRVDESNWTKLFDDLELEEDDTGFANVILLTYRQKYSEGTANFENGSDVVLGYSGDENWVSLPPDNLSIQNLETSETYAINLNNSEDEETNELILQSNYKEDTDDDVPYIITGATNKIRVRDASSIQQIRSLKGGSGKKVKKIVLENVPMFKDQAKTVAKAELAIAKRSLCIGSASTIAQKLGILLDRSGPQEGRTIFFDLPESRGIRCSVRIESFRWADNSTRNARIDGNTLQGLDYELEFTPSVTREQLRELSKKLAIAGVTTTDEYILDIESFSSIVAFKDCVTPVEPITAADQNIFEVEDGLDYREVETKTYYFAPATTHPDSEGYFTGLTKFSNFS